MASAISKETAQTHLDAWLAAELAVTKGQSYTIGTRELQRADLKEIRETIDYWQKKVQQASGRRSRVYRALPRDL